MRVLFLIPMCREECIIAQRATISMLVFFLIPVRRGWSLVGWYVLTMMRVLFLIPAWLRGVVLFNNVGIIFNTRVAEERSCGGGYAHPLIAWVLFLIPVWQSESRAEIGEHQ